MKYCSVTLSVIFFRNARIWLTVMNLHNDTTQRELKKMIYRYSSQAGESGKPPAINPPAKSDQKVLLYLPFSHRTQWWIRISSSWK